MQKPLVSVIVCIYNSEKYLDKCITSLLNQTLKNIEIILVNDASPDNSKEIMEKYAMQDSRIVTIYNKVNGSPNPGNVGILAAKADYFGFVDADDWVELDMYEKLYEKSEEGKIDVVISDSRYVDEGGDLIRNEIIWESKIFEGENVKRNVADNFALKGGRLFTNIWKKSIVTDNNLFFLEKNNYNDAIVGLWYLKANSFAKVDKIMYNYMQNTTSITHRFNNMRIITDRPLAHEDRFKRSKDCGLYEQYKEVIDYSFYIGFLVNTSQLLAARFTRPRYKDINNLKRRFLDYIPEGIKGNRLYQQYSHPKQFSLIRINTYIGATIVWAWYAVGRFLSGLR